MVGKYCILSYPFFYLIFPAENLRDVYSSMWTPLLFLVSEEVLLVFLFGIILALVLSFCYSEICSFS